MVAVFPLRRLGSGRDPWAGARRDGSVHILNVPNRGAAPDLRAGSCGGGPRSVGAAWSDAAGAGSVRRRWWDYSRSLAEYQWLAADAAWQYRRALEQALASNPLALSLSLAQRMLDEAR
ncbi:MAG: hypothetical protein R2856_11480 [Caldilineaceae bacterium]